MRAFLPYGRLLRRPRIPSAVFALLLPVIAIAAASRVFGDGSRSRADGQLVDGDPIHGRHQPPDTFATRTEGEWITLVPPGREGHAMVMDEARHQVVIVGGISYGAVWGDAWAVGVDAPSTAQRILGNWSERFGPEGSLALDTRRDRIIRYGGTRTGVVDGPPGTWRGDDPYVVGASLAGNGSWEQLVPTYVPGTELPRPRHGHVAIDDATRDRMVVFGGSSWDDVYGSLGIQHPNDDLWQLTLADPPRWNRIAETGDVPHHAMGSAAYDAAHDRMWYVADGLLWRLDLATAAWDSIPVSGPLPPHDATIALDPAALRLYAHHSGDLWVMDLRSPGLWEALPVDGETPTGNGKMVWDPTEGRLLVFSGRLRGSNDPGPHVAAILWAIRPDEAGARWTRIYDGLVPGAHLDAGVYDARRDRVIAFGYYQPFSGMWELRSGTQWRSMHVAPLVTDDVSAKIVLDEVADRLVMVTYNPQGARTYAYDLSSPTAQWTPVGIPGPAGWYMLPAYDAGRQRVIRFGWSDASGGEDFRIEWLDGDAWSQIPLAGGLMHPPMLFDRFVASDPDSGRVFYTGLQTDLFMEPEIADLWTFELGDSARWSRRFMGVGTGSDLRYVPSVAYDPVRRQMVFYAMYGGCCGWRFEGEVYSLERGYSSSFILPTTWLEYFNPEHALHGLVYDGRHDRLIAFGGSTYDRISDGPDSIYYASALAFEKPRRSIRVDVLQHIVRPGTHATAQVTAFSDLGFDARQIDLTTVRVAGVPVRRDGGGRPIFVVRDVDKDGLDDIEIHFDAHDLPLTETNVAVKLWGRTLDDVPFEGTASVVVGTPGRQGGAEPRAARPGALTFEIALAADGAGFECRLALLPNARVELFDVTGRRIASAVAAVGAVQTLTLTPVSRPAPGLYFARLTGPATLTRKVLVLR